MPAAIGDVGDTGKHSDARSPLAFLKKSFPFRGSCVIRHGTRARAGIIARQSLGPVLIAQGRHKIFGAA